MRLTRHTALAAGAAALMLQLAALSGCSLTSGQSDDTDRAGGTPAASTPAPTSAPAVPTTPASTPTETPSATDSADAASAEPTVGPTAVTSPATPVHVPVTTYSDKTGLLQLPVSNASLPGSPAGLRDFARAQLKKMWHDQFQDDPGCEGIAQVRIKRASASAAYATISWGATTPTCPQYAGNPGWWEIWGSQGGAWSLTLHGEGLASCTDLVAHAVPREIYPTCTDGSHKVPNPVA